MIVPLIGAIVVTAAVVLHNAWLANLTRRVEEIEAYLAKLTEKLPL